MKVAFSFVFIASAISSIAAFTIDLPEVRQYYFAKYGNDDHDKDLKDVQLKEGEFIYNNYYSNSKHHEHNPGYEGPVDFDKKSYDRDGSDSQKYAEDFEYQSYMEQKVETIVHSGSRYLEGLRRAIENYTETLKNCSAMNYTTLVATGSYESCAKATEKSEHVRRFAQLALHTTRLLQERAAVKDPQEKDTYEDKALLLRLAWFLDKLTSLTGYEPNAKNFLPDENTTTTETPTTPGVNIINKIGSIPELRDFYIKCVQDNDTSVPATVRCKFPRPMPKEFLDYWKSTGLEINDTQTIPLSVLESPNGDLSALSSDNNEQTSNQDEPAQTEPLLSTILAPLTDLTSVRLRKRSISDEKPLEKFLIYYAKHKAWSNANADSEKDSKTDFQNHNKITKRSVSKNTGFHSGLDLRVPENPFEDISGYLKHASKPFAKNNTEQEELVKKYIENNGIKKRNKRSYYEKRIANVVPDDPKKDISYYVKNREGTDYNPNPIQAAEVRLGLEKVFQTGNPLIIQRYGSNYNPLVIDQYIYGFSQSILSAYAGSP